MRQTSLKRQGGERNFVLLISMNLISAARACGRAPTHCINTIIVHKYSSTFNIGGIVARKFREESTGRV